MTIKGSQFSDTPKGVILKLGSDGIAVAEIFGRTGISQRPTSIGRRRMMVCCRPRCAG